MSRLSRAFVIVVAGLLAVVAVPGGVHAQSRQKIESAIKFMSPEDRGRFMLGYLHFGGTFTEHEVIQLLRVVDSEQKSIPGHFAMKVVFDWSTPFGDNSTTATVFFNELGDVYDIKATTTSILSRPFDLANGAIQALGSLILEAFKDQMSAKERAELKQFIDAGNAKGLMIAGLNLQKRLGV